MNPRCLQGEQEVQSGFNGSFAGSLKKIAGAVCSLFYVLLCHGRFCRKRNDCLIFGPPDLVWNVDGERMYRLIKEAKLKEQARKAKERRASEEVSVISRVYGELRSQLSDAECSTGADELGIGSNGGHTEFSAIDVTEVRWSAETTPAQAMKAARVREA